MMSLEVIVGIIAIGIAIWQLKLQREEIRLNGQINSLIHIASILKDKISQHEEIIDDRKGSDEKWKGHADRINKELRPLLEKVNEDLIELVAIQNTSLDTSEICKALRLNGK